MTTYNYICSQCGHKYQEVREVNIPQWFTKCNAGCGTDYTETSLEDN